MKGKKIERKKTIPCTEAPRRKTKIPGPYGERENKIKIPRWAREKRIHVKKEKKPQH